MRCYFMSSFLLKNTYNAIRVVMMMTFVISANRRENMTAVPSLFYDIQPVTLSSEVQYLRLTRWGFRYYREQQCLKPMSSR